jgi:hypothetical protein
MMDFSKEAIVSYMKSRLKAAEHSKDKLTIPIEIFTYIDTYFLHIEEKLGRAFLKDTLLNKAYEFLEYGYGSLNQEKKTRLNELSISLITRINFLDKVQPVG